MLSEVINNFSIFLHRFFGGGRKKKEATIFIPENKSSKQVFSLPGNGNQSSNYSITIERLECFSIEF